MSFKPKQKFTNLSFNTIESKSVEFYFSGNETNTTSSNIFNPNDIEEVA